MTTPLIAPSGESSVETVVHAEGFAPMTSVNVHLASERSRDGRVSTALCIDFGSRRTLSHMDRNDPDVRIALRSPRALEALISGLLQLVADPDGAAMLAAIGAPAVERGQ